MIFPILQASTVQEEEIASKVDSAKVTFEHFAEQMAANPTETLEGLMHQAIEFGIKLVAAIIIYIVGAWLIKRIRRMIVNGFNRRKADKTLVSFVASLVSITLTVVLIIITIGTLGINTTSIAALLAAGGMAIGMALSGTVQNFAGGMMILAFKPFKAGDFIEAQGYSGTVTAVSIVSTSLTTPDNRSIILPNGALFNGNIDNYSRHPLRRVSWDIGVEYGTDSAACTELLMKLLRSDARVLDASAGNGAEDPAVVLSKLADSAVVFTVRVWVKKEDYWGLLYDYNRKVYDELPKAGIGFPFPQMDVHFYNTADNTPATARNR